MEITVSHEAGRVPITVLHVKGAVTSNRELEQAAQAAFDGGARNILIDLTEVPYMATAGLRALHFIYTLLRTDAPEESDEAVKRGISAGTFYSPHLKLLRPSAHVSEALKVAGYDMFLEIHRDLKRAVASF
ncbi:MAG TPA: STAS domain-containing protein [Roseiflexaceae bacterium]|nr:STAS domain-containing protein [Roseiflexaceae bacterium]